VAFSTAPPRPRPAPPSLPRRVRIVGVTERLARWCSTHPRRTLGIWALAIISALAAVALAMGELTTEGHVTGDPESRQGEALISASFPPDPKRVVTDIIVVSSDRYRVQDPAFSAFVHRNHVAAQRTGVVINATSISRAATRPSSRETDTRRSSRSTSRHTTRSSRSSTSSPARTRIPTSPSL
jgi:hypothetical protein